MEFTPLAAILVNKNLGSLDAIAKRYRLDVDKLKDYNPAYKRGQIAAQAPRRILMPANLATYSFETAPEEIPEIASTPNDVVVKKATTETHDGNHQVKSGETLWSIAKRYGVSISNLRKFNGLGRNAVLRIGQTLKLGP